MINLKIRYFFRAASALSIGLLWAMQSAHAADVDVEVRAGGTYSDNARREELNETSDTIATVGFWLEVSEVTRRFDGSLEANVDHNVYVDNTFGDETFASFAGSAELLLVPRVFSWVITDNFGKLRTNPFDADTPDNREEVNRFSTGPVFRIRLGSATAVELGGLYKNTHFEDSNFDNDVVSGNISLIRVLSQARSVSLNFTANRIEYDNTDINSNFDLQSAFIAVQSRISRGELNASIGVNQIHDHGTTSGGLLTDISWTREISSASSISVGYNSRFSEAGDLFEKLQNVQNATNESSPLSGTADPLEISQVRAVYQFSRNDNGFNFSFSQSDYDYENDDFLDRDLIAVRLGLRRQFGSAWHAGFQVRAERTEYDQSGREDDDLQLSITLGRRLSRTLDVDLTAGRIERSSNTVGFDYEENRYTVQFVYTPRAR